MAPKLDGLVKTVEQFVFQYLRIDCLIRDQLFSLIFGFAANLVLPHMTLWVHVTPQVRVDTLP